jgi:DNA-binding transcriptional regulator YhcF (GntR family)
MFVAEGAKQKVLEKRRRAFFDHYMLPMIVEAKKLSMTAEELYTMMMRGYEQ